MTDLRKAAEQALEALESVYGKGKRCEAAIKELRQALAQPERNCDNCESLRKAAFDRINELEGKLAERECNALFHDVLKSWKLYAKSLGLKLKEKNA
jgi:hypothetical protein